MLYILKAHNLDNSNGIRTHNRLFCKGTLNHLAKLNQMIELYCEYLSVRSIWLYVIIMSPTRFIHSLHSDIMPVLNKKFLDIQATTECKFSLKPVREIIITHNHKLNVLDYSFILLIS